MIWLLTKLFIEVLLVEVGFVLFGNKTGRREQAECYLGEQKKKAIGSLSTGNSGGMKRRDRRSVKSVDWRVTLRITRATQ